MPFLGHQEILMILVFVLRGVTFGFLCHLFLRGFWIALVCLRSAYPGGINFDRLHIKGRYLERSKRVNLTEHIVGLDTLSGLIFFGSFLFILILLGFLTLFLVTIYIVLFIQPNVGAPSFLKSMILVLSVIYLADFITQGLLRRNRIIRKLFLPVYWYFNLFSLGFIYRPYLQIVSTNINKWKAALFILFFYISSSIFAFISLQDHLNWKNLYDKRTFPPTSQEIFKADEFYQDRIADESWVRIACIQSEVIKNEYLRVFIPYKAEYVDAIAELKKESFAEIVSLSVNDSIVRHIEWFGDTRKEQLGIAANLPINKLPNGKNVLGIQIAGQHFYFGKRSLEIPFWKER